LTHSGHFTYEMVKYQPQIRRRSGKVRQLKTTEPRRKPLLVKNAGSFQDRNTEGVDGKWLASWLWRLGSVAQPKSLKIWCILKLKSGD